MEGAIVVNEGASLVIDGAVVGVPVVGDKVTPLGEYVSPNSVGDFEGPDVGDSLESVG